MDQKEFRIVFLGTSDFAVPVLEALLHSRYKLVGVVTAPDKEAGRGRKVRFSPVKEFALEHKLTLLQPEKLKNEDFLAELSKLKPDLQVVVAFRMLPREVWTLSPAGTINLHASLLPQYRGAAPINHVIMNGETKTGITTFFIDEKIDTGSIIRQSETDIGEEETFGELYARLKAMGPELVLKTVDDIFHGKANKTDQQGLVQAESELMPAPKIFKENCQVDFSKNLEEVYNFIRGLSPWPGAFSFLQNGDERLYVKIYKTKKEFAAHRKKAGSVITDGRTGFKVAVPGGYLAILELQPAGKRSMQVSDFLNGFNVAKDPFFETRG